MPNHDFRGTDVRTDRLTTIERLLKEYRITKDLPLLRRAIELWNEVEAERRLLIATNRSVSH